MLGEECGEKEVIRGEEFAVFINRFLGNSASHFRMEDRLQLCAQQEN